MAPAAIRRPPMRGAPFGRGNIGREFPHTEAPNVAADLLSIDHCAVPQPIVAHRAFHGKFVGVLVHHHENELALRHPSNPPPTPPRLRRAITRSPNAFRRCRTPAAIGNERCLTLMMYRSSSVITAPPWEREGALAARPLSRSGFALSQRCPDIVAVGPLPYNARCQRLIEIVNILRDIGQLRGRGAQSHIDDREPRSS